MAGFKYAGNIKSEESARVNAIITNSDTLSIGDVCVASGGYVSEGGTATLIFGVVEGFVNSKGIDLANAPTSTYDGTYTDGTVGVGTYVATSDNQTDKKVMAIVNVDPYALWKNTADEAVAITDQFQHFVCVAAGDQIDGNSNSATVGAMQLWKFQPDIGDATTEALYRISGSQLYTYEKET